MLGLGLNNSLAYNKGHVSTGNLTEGALMGGTYVGFENRGRFDCPVTFSDCIEF